MRFCADLCPYNFCIGQCCISISLFFILSCTKKIYFCSLRIRCLPVLFQQDYTFVILINKARLHIIPLLFLQEISNIACPYYRVSSASVELVILSFCFLEKLIGIPDPLQSSCTTYDVSIHHVAMVIDSAESIRGIFIVPFRYCRTLFSFPQSSLSEARTLVVKNDTAVWISQWALAWRNTNNSITEILKYISWVYLR